MPSPRHLQEPASGLRNHGRWRDSQDWKQRLGPTGRAALERPQRRRSCASLLRTPTGEGMVPKLGGRDVTLQSFVDTYGYLAIIVGTFFEWGNDPRPGRVHCPSGISGAPVGDRLRLPGEPRRRPTVLLPGPPPRSGRAGQAAVVAHSSREGDDASGTVPETVHDRLPLSLRAADGDALRDRDAQDTGPGIFPI